jgi:hypothetical protein
MRIKSIALTCLLVSCYPVVTSAPAFAGSICWIDHITKAKDGIHVHFIQKAVLSIGIIDSSGGNSIRHTVSNGVVRDQAGHAQDHLLAKDDVELYASQLVHDSCSYRASASEEVGKLTAKSAMRLPGLQPIFTTQVIATDGTVSETEAASPRP